VQVDLSRKEIQIIVKALAMYSITIKRLHSENKEVAELADKIMFKLVEVLKSSS